MKKGSITILSVLVGAFLGAISVNRVKGRIIALESKKIDKYKSYYNMLNQWLQVKQKGFSIEEYLLKNKINTVAIYGLGEMGERLIDEIQGTDIKIEYGIDKSADGMYSEIEVLTLDDDLKEVDAIIVTAIFAVDEIRENLEEKISSQIIALDDLVFNILNENI